MNQMKYSAYALLLVLGITPVAHFLTKLSSNPATVQNTSTTPSSLPTTKKAVKNVAGQNLFQSNCQSCHSLNKVLTGPALLGVETRGPWTDRKNLVKWVKNPAAMINETAYTKALFQQYNNQTMPSFPQLSEQEVGSIFDYIKEASTN